MGSRGQISEESAMLRDVLRELRELRGMCAGLGRQMSDMQERQTAMERQMERLASSSSSSSITSSPPDSSPSSSAQSSPPSSSSSSSSAPFAASLSVSSRALASYGSSCRGPAGTTAGSFLAEPESSWAPPVRPGHLNFPKYVLSSQFKSTLAGFMSMMNHTCQAPDTPSSPRMQAPTTSLLPASVSQQPSVDLTQTTLVAILPSGNLLGSFDKPWMIERMASAAEAYLPKHDFPLPGYDKFFKNQRKPLLVAADDQFRKLLHYSWEELREINTFRLYPTYLHDTLGQWFQEWDRLGPERVSPVYVVTCPMIDRNGRVLHTLSRSQAFYDDRGEYSWSVSVIDNWQYSDDPAAQSPASAEDEADATAHQPQRQTHQAQQPQHPSVTHPAALPSQLSLDVSQLQFDEYQTPPVLDELLDGIYSQFLHDDIS